MNAVIGSRYETLTCHVAENIGTMWKAVEIDAWLGARKTSLEDARSTVTGIIGRVQNEGDAALRDFAKKYCELGDIAVSEDEREAAYDLVDTKVVESLIEAEARIERFHERQRPRDLWLEEMDPGIVPGVKTTALNRVGIYVPGGRAVYPSSALMCAVPARVAGVHEICACSPPPIKPLTLVALDIAGVTEIYNAGGAQAIAAMALGTESISPVQKIVGPGNIYVTLAKMMLREKVEIDFPAGPSEIGIIADETASPSIVAADILAQSEHDPNAACILITTDPESAGEGGTGSAQDARGCTEKRDHRAVAEKFRLYRCRRSGGSNRGIGYGGSRASVDPGSRSPVGQSYRVKNAGAIFVGKYSAVACGDYAVGTNHVLPTAGYSKDVFGP